MAVICGKNGLIYISGTEFVEANAWSPSVETDSEEYWSFGATWKSRCVGASGWSGSVAGFQDNAKKQLFSAATAGVAVALLLYPNRADLADYYNGSAVFSFSTDMDNSPRPVAISADFAGDGTLVATGFS